MNLKRKIDLVKSATQALNKSATWVYFLAEGGNSYRECLELINSKPLALVEFVELVGVEPSKVIMLLDKGVLYEPALNMVVANSKPKLSDNLFA